MTKKGRTVDKAYKLDLPDDEPPKIYVGVLNIRDRIPVPAFHYAHGEGAGTVTIQGNLVGLHLPTVDRPIFLTVGTALALYNILGKMLEPGDSE